MDLKHVGHLTLLFKKKVGIMGTIHFWGLTIDIVTTICVVLAIGLSVDYSSHIGHTFMIRSGTRKGKLGKRDPCSITLKLSKVVNMFLLPVLSRKQVMRILKLTN